MIHIEQRCSYAVRRGEAGIYMEVCPALRGWSPANSTASTRRMHGNQETSRPRAGEDNFEKVAWPVKVGGHLPVIGAVRETILEELNTH